MIDLCKKSLIFAIILFFVSAGIVPNIGGAVENKSSDLLARQIFAGQDLSSQLLIDVQEIHDLTYYGYELDQFQTNEGNIGFDVGYFYLAQSFKPSMTPLVKVDLFGYTTSNYNPLEISIREYVDGDDLTCISLPGTEIPSHLAWFECDFPDIEVEPEKTYYIVISQIGDGKYNWQGTQGAEQHYDRGFGYSRQEGTQGWTNLSEFFLNFDFCFKTYSYGDNLPPNIPSINGSISGKAGKKYEYQIYTIDPEENDVYYLIDWGDGTISDWLGLYNSGEVTHFNHSWDEKDSYTIKVKSKDIFGDKSDWATLEVSMPKNRAINTPLIKFLEEHSILYRLFQRLIRL